MGKKSSGSYGAGVPCSGKALAGRTRSSKGVKAVREGDTGLCEARAFGSKAHVEPQGGHGTWN